MHTHLCVAINANGMGRKHRAEQSRKNKTASRIGMRVESVNDVKHLNFLNCKHFQLHIFSIKFLNGNSKGIKNRDRK